MVIVGYFRCRVLWVTGRQLLFEVGFVIFPEGGRLVVYYCSRGLYAFTVKWMSLGGEYLVSRRGGGWLYRGAGPCFQS